MLSLNRNYAFEAFLCFIHCKAFSPLLVGCKRAMKWFRLCFTISLFFACLGKIQIARGDGKKKNIQHEKNKKSRKQCDLRCEKTKGFVLPRGRRCSFFFFFGATLMKREFQSHYCSRFAHNEGTKEKNYFLIWEAVLQPGQSRQLYILIQITSKSNDEVADYITLSYYPHPILTYN